MTREQALQFRKLLESQTDAMTDEQILEYPSFVKKWKSEEFYKAGKRLEYNEVIYKVLQDHTSQTGWTPEDATSLYAKVLISDANVIPDWERPSSTNAYMAGDKVRHSGKTWESLVDDNVWEPGTEGTDTLWREIE